MTRPGFLIARIISRTVYYRLHRHLRGFLIRPIAIAHNEAEGRDGKCHKH